MIDLDKEDYNVLLNILKNHLENCEIFVFGSRAEGRGRKFSDVDICIKGKKEIPREVINNLKETLSESSLPVSVDIIDYHAISPEFRSVIGKAVKICIASLEKNPD
jgi:uncharacterized protein